MDKLLEILHLKTDCTCLFQHDHDSQHDENPLKSNPCPMLQPDAIELNPFVRTGFTKKTAWIIMEQ
jgi:hypothetical protein